MAPGGNPLHFNPWIADERRPSGGRRLTTRRRTGCRSTWVMPHLAPTPHRCEAGLARKDILPRKEVIQPQLPLRLPCYDFVPIAGPTLDGCPLAVSPPASGVTNFHDVTGGVYKARERIHRSNA